MSKPPSFPVSRRTLTLAAAVLSLAFAYACGGKVVYEGGSGNGGSGGNGGAGGGPSDACGVFGPENPNVPCKTDGAQCFYADTGCAQTWTCMGGTWSEQQVCSGG
jgi:hypothetical protein